MNKIIGVKEASIKWNISERSVRNYCALGRVKDAVLVGKTWMIPEDAKKPIRSNGKENKNYLHGLEIQSKYKDMYGITIFLKNKTF